MHRNSKSGIYTNKSVRYNKITNSKTCNGSLYYVDNEIVRISPKYYKALNKYNNDDN